MLTSLPLLEASNPEPVNFQEESKPTGGSMSHATGRHPVAPTSGIVPVGANLPGAAESSLSGAPSGPLDTSYGASDRSKPIVPSEISTKPDTIDHSGGGIKPALPQESTQGSSQTASSVNQIEPLKLTQTPDTSDHPSFIGSENKSYLAQATTASALGGTEKLNTDPIDAPSTGVRAPGETAYPKSPYPKEPVVERDESSTSEPRPTAPEVMNAYHKQLPSRSRPIDEKEPSTKFTDDHSGIRTEGETPGERAEGTQKPLSADSSKEQTKPQEPKDPEATRQPETENIVRSTGFAAEGGDFDASEPGAGKEADRMYK